ncbi:hypothetical protein HaLaN_18489 [Haematococcus lacustris]|uniref:Uncharacterized protein n=1 Tax=Haematococcus lacustris TaxID=44745 RepID=A0A699ZG90_HAELA|nr:hypothetical protein HaLaN_18489 [Haematococcus lacustris]
MVIEEVVVLSGSCRDRRSPAAHHRVDAQQQQLDRLAASLADTAAQLQAALEQLEARSAADQGEASSAAQQVHRLDALQAEVVGLTTKLQQRSDELEEVSRQKQALAELVQQRSAQVCDLQQQSSGDGAAPAPFSYLVGPLKHAGDYRSSLLLPPPSSAPTPRCATPQHGPTLTKHTTLAPQMEAGASKLVDLASKAPLHSD